MSSAKSTLRFAISLIGIAAFVWAIWIVGRDGLSLRSAKYALDQRLLSSADRAVTLNGKSPEAYYARAFLYRNGGQTAEAINDLERAARLRPGDHFLHLELGYTRYLAGDIAGATVDFEAAASRAPFYAQPRWYLGNMLLQAGRLEDGFAELRRAVKSDPAYLPNTIQLATETFGDDTNAIINAVGTEAPETRLALERYFIQHDNIPAAMQLFRTGRDRPEGDLLTLLSDLLAAKRFADAHEVWLLKSETKRAPGEDISSISDGGFESPINPDATGFDWQIGRRLERTQLSRDSHEFHNGRYSLRIDYEGKSSPATKVVSQLVLVESGKDYHLAFVAKTAALVTGGLPLVTVTGATDGKLLAQSSALPEGTSSWRNYEVECKTAPDTRAVIISVQRGECSSSPCPAFGTVWFDDFSWRVR